MLKVSEGQIQRLIRQLCKAFGSCIVFRNQIGGHTRGTIRGWEFLAPHFSLQTTMEDSIVWWFKRLRQLRTQFFIAIMGHFSGEKRGFGRRNKSKYCRLIDLMYMTYMLYKHRLWWQYPICLFMMVQILNDYFWMLIQHASVECSFIKLIEDGQNVFCLSPDFKNDGIENTLVG